MRSPVRAVIAGLILCTASPLPGAEWLGESGDFTVAENWSTGSVPTTLDDARIINGAEVTLASSAEVAELMVGTPQGQGSQLNLTSGTLAAHAVRLGGPFTTFDGEPEIRVVGDGTLQVGDGGIHIGDERGEYGRLQIGFVSSLASEGDFVLGSGGSGYVSIGGATTIHPNNVIIRDGAWNQGRGLVDQQHGDFLVGDGGPRQGELNNQTRGRYSLSGGTLQTHGNFVIANQHSRGSATFYSGNLAVTGTPSSSIIIGGGSGDEETSDGAAELEIIGGGTNVVATGSFLMNPEGHSESATLLANLSAEPFSTITVGGNAHITNGRLAIELEEFFVPKPGDNWLLIEAGSHLADQLATIDASVATGVPMWNPDTGESFTATFDPLTHATPAFRGRVLGRFSSVDTSNAVLPEGLTWHVGYNDKDVTLSVIGEATNSGDFNNDGVLDATDIDALSEQIWSGNNHPDFDLSGDGLVNAIDHDVWTEVIANVYHGDANFDGEFNSADFVIVFASLQYEVFNGPASWSTGDWNGDGLFNSSDLVKAFTSGGYEQGPKPSAVPEPNAGMLLLIAGITLQARRSPRHQGS